MARTIVTPIQKRFSDVDVFRHVNNVSQQMYFDVGKTEYYRQVLNNSVLFGSLRIITVATQTSYISQIRYEDDIYVTTKVSKIGNKSLTLFQRIICREADGSERICTESTSAMVAFDFDEQTSAVVPDLWREAILSE